MQKRLILQTLPRPNRRDLIEEIYWLCDTLGLSSGRDVDNLSTQIILKILQHSSNYAGISSDELGSLLAISQGRVNHHLRNLSRSGMVYRDRRLIHLRGRSLRESIREIRRDANRIFDELESVADEIDTLAGVSSKPEEKKALILMAKAGIILKD
ncbi:winged helix-turn-helix transcriptional regulator [Methanospirillum purgamenti]|jgi:predicted transcriptional regulator|uniref:Winged helix-turn-helix transcriptional regulator n=1 Tax=Methanospirillum hungatei TaxID=2203 RepID=A0A8F5VMC7_METHU|nr:winged helix-turn-helix transcriptional regulator [Methanospirillum hungatei]QXO95464.1 winged helix-turn-helix transcriptional regulator [Methanospirillum hungatei]